MSLAGVACASAGMSIIVAAAFPVQGEVPAMPLLGVAFPGRRSDPPAREPVQPSLEALCREPPRLTL